MRCTFRKPPTEIRKGYRLGEEKKNKVSGGDTWGEGGVSTCALNADS